MDLLLLGLRIPLSEMPEVPEVVVEVMTENRLFVGNLAWGVDNLALESLFSVQGKVLEAKVVYVRDSGRSRGFGFVTYDTADEMNNAIESLDGVLNSREVVVVGPGTRDKEGQFIPATVKEGDIVLLPKYGGTEVKLCDKEYISHKALSLSVNRYHLYRDEDILGALHN